MNAVPLPVDWREFFTEYLAEFRDLLEQRTRRSIPGLSPNMWTPDVLDVFVFPFGMVEVSTGVWDALGERPRRAKRGVGFTVRLGTPDEHRLADGLSQLVSDDDATITDVRRVFDNIVAEATRRHG